MLKILSLFSGIGAFESALNRLGIEYEIVNYCEIDKYASKAYTLIHGVDESKNLGDITKIDLNELPKDIDLITYGFPCQDISIAGKQKGLVDDNGELTRSGLLYEAFKIIEHIKPKIAIFENVKNLMSKKFESDLEAYLDDLDNIGYNTICLMLNAKDFNVPQNRERVFGISIRDDDAQSTTDMLYNLADIQYNYNQLTKALCDVIDDVVDKKYYINNERAITFIKNIQNNQNLYDLNTPKVNRIGGLFDNNKTHQAGSVYDINGLSPTLNTMQGGYRQPCILLNGKIRKLTPQECFRLMGFSDEEFNKIKDNFSDTQLYKMAGNSIVVDVLVAIFDKIYNS